MSMSNPPITEHNLHAYVDGQLSPERRAQVEAYLATNSDAAQRVAAYREQNELLAELFEPVEQETVPRRLKIAAKTRRPRFAWRYAAVAAWTAIAVGGGWLMRGAVIEAPVVAYRIVDHAAVAHAVYTPEVRHPVEVTADQKEHLVKWLSKRMGEPLHAPELFDQGYHLVGGRLLPGDNGPAAQFMYESSQGDRLTLYAMANSRADPRETAFRYGENDGVRVLYWMNGPLGYAVVGDVDKGALLDIAHAVYQQVN